MSADLDLEVRLALLRLFVERERAPALEEVAQEARAAPDDVRAAYRRLADGHVIVLEPGTTDRLWMVNPFSAVPTAFKARVGRRSWFGNCIWDGLGIVAMLGGDGALESWCPDCGEPLAIDVRGRRAEGDGIAHFAVPAARWWDDVGFT